MELNDFPKYYQASRKVSVEYQNYYFKIKRISILLLLLAGILAIYSFQVPEHSYWSYGAMISLVAVVLVLTLVLKNRRYDQIWHESQALAETGVTLCWQYVMGVDNFEEGYLEQVSFQSRVKHVANEFKDLDPILKTSFDENASITSKMEELRNMPFSDKKAYYVKNRIEQLQDEYFQKAVWNHQRYHLWFINIVLMQILAMVSIGFLLMEINTSWSFMALLTTIVIAIMSWFQLHPHQEQKQAYTIALKEIDYIKQQCESITTDTELSQFVADAESTISRSHTLWLVQKREMSLRSVLV